MCPSRRWTGYQNLPRPPQKASLRNVLAPGDVDPKLKEVLNSEELEKAYQFRTLAEGQDTSER